MKYNTSRPNKKKKTYLITSRYEKSIQGQFFFFCKELIDIYHRIDGGTFFEAIKISHKISSFKIKKKLISLHRLVLCQNYISYYLQNHFYVLRLRNPSTSGRMVKLQKLKYSFFSDQTLK